MSASEFDWQSDRNELFFAGLTELLNLVTYTIATLVTMLSTEMHQQQQRW